MLCVLGGGGGGAGPLGPMLDARSAPDQIVVRIYSLASFCYTQPLFVPLEALLNYIIMILFTLVERK